MPATITFLAFPPVNGRPRAIVCDDVPVEVDLDDIFRALNRIDGVELDCASMGHEWQRKLRRALDAHGCPSMSVGDVIHFTSVDGRELGGIRCDRVGWARDDRTRADIIDNTHIYFA